MTEVYHVRVTSPTVRVTASTVGPRGLTGPAGDAPTVVAATALSALRLVTAAGEYVDPDTESVFRLAGLTQDSAIQGEEVSVVRFGLFPGAWADGPVWCGPLGSLVQIAPTTRYTLRVGCALGGDLALDLQPPIENA